MLYGRAGAGKTCACLREVREQAGRQQLGSPLILLTPEQATFQAERELAAGGGFIAARVLGFRRLAQMVLNETGGAARPAASDLARRMIIRKILAEHGPRLGLLKQAAKQRTFSQTLLTLLDECKAYGIKPQDLAGISAGQGDGRLLVKPALAAKLADLALVYGEYEAQMAGRYTDPADYLSLMTERISRSRLIQGAGIWLDGFDWFTGEEYRVLAALGQTAAHMTVTLCLDDPANPEHRREESLYHRQCQTYEALRQLANQNGWDWREIPVESPGRYRAPLLGHIERCWAAYQADPMPIADGSLTIAEAANCRVEAEAIARDMIRLCREKEYRWKDIAVLVADPAYMEILEITFADHDIPCFVDRPRPAGYHPLAEFLRSALDVILEQFDYEPVFRALKTGFIALPAEDIDLLENYVLEFGIRGKRWIDETPWDFVRRYSMEEDEAIKERQQEKLDRIQAIRQAAAGPLVAFARSLPRRGTAREYTGRLYELALELAIPDTLVRWSTSAEQAGRLAQADEHRQVWNSVVELFDEIIASCGDDPISPREYRDILNEGLDGLTLGLIPAGLDHVLVTPLERVRLLRAKAVYLPGVNDGVLPPRVREEGLLTAAEREELAALEWKLPPAGASSAFAASYLMYTAMTRASDMLWVSYSLADAEGAGLQPSVAVRRLKELAPDCGVQSFGLEPAAGSEKNYLAHPRQSASLLTAALRRCLTGGQRDIDPLWREVYRFCLAEPKWKTYLARSLAGLFHVNQTRPLAACTAGRLYARDAVLRGSVTAFEIYRACPFQHFARYGLNLKERPAFCLEAPGIGMLLHAVMRRFDELVREEAPDRHWGDLTDEAVNALCDVCVDELAPKLQHEILFSSAQFRHWEKRLRRTVRRVIGRLTEFDRVSRFKPIALEQSFGREEGLPALVFDLGGGTKLELAGQIDRIDCAEHEGRNYLLIIDYKSGHATLRLPEVYYGLRLQLLTYLLAARQGARQLVGDEALPAGVLYCYLLNPKLSKDQYILPEKMIQELNGQLKMPGWVLADPQVIRALDQEIQTWSKFTKVGLSKNDEILKAAAGSVKSMEEFELLLGHAGDQCVQTAGQILAGDIAIRPYKIGQQTACRYCRYRPLCQFDRLLPENQFQQLVSLDDATIMKRLSERRKS